MTTSTYLRRRAQQGFTLVEMAIVLAVIGLIIGAVAIAKDVQRNAEYQKVGNKFLYQWKMAYDQHYQRTGVVFGDCQQAPTYMVNGAGTTIGGVNACARPGQQAVAGIPENFANTGLKICEGQGYAVNTVGAGDAGLAVATLRSLAAAAGVRWHADIRRLGAVCRDPSSRREGRAATPGGRRAQRQNDLRDDSLRRLHAHRTRCVLPRHAARSATLQRRQQSQRGTLQYLRPQHQCVRPRSCHRFCAPPD